MKPVFGGFDTRLKFIEFRHKNLTGSPGKPHFNGFPEAEFKEFEPRVKSAKNRFQLSAGLNFGTLNTVLSGIKHI